MFAKYLDKMNSLGGTIKESQKDNVLKAVMVGVLAVGAMGPDLMASQSIEIVQARILNSKAIYQTITAYENQQKCDDVRRKVSSANTGENNDMVSVAGTLLGAVGGALLGNYIGAGAGNVVAKVGGGIVGAYGGNKVAGMINGKPSDRDVYEVSEECKTVSVPVTRNVLQGYDIEAQLPNGEKIRGRIRELPNDQNIDVEETRSSSYRLK